jgi:hypothetical protein
MDLASRSVSRRRAIKLGLSGLIVAALRGRGESPLIPAEGASAHGVSAPSFAPNEVTLQGSVGAALDRSIARLSQPPYSLEWLRADLSFERKRAFTNFSGDVSGRFLEIASLASDPAKPSPATLPGLLATVADYQKADGHFGAEVDWRNDHDVMTTGTPILWGNARLLIGLVTAHERFHDPKILAAARQLGDFYVTTADIFCDPSRQTAYRASTGYANGFDTCYFPAIESLVRLYWLTQDARYLQTAERLAPLFYQWDHLPLPHTHGDLCAQYGLLLLYEVTQDPSYLAHVEARWDEMVRGDYVCPTGGVGEKFTVTSERDEGCAEADWLRVTLRLWALTGRTSYLDMADRLIHNEYRANQFPDGGFGHRFLESDAAGTKALGRHSQEATWCCCFHGPLGLFLLKPYVAVGANYGIYLNFPLESAQTLTASGRQWKFSIAGGPPAPEALQVAVRLEPADGAGTAGTRLFIRVPDWATAVSVRDAAGHEIALEPVNAHLVRTGPLTAGNDLVVAYRKQLRIENRHFDQIKVEPHSMIQLSGVVLRDGPHVLFAPEATDPPLLLVDIAKDGSVQLKRTETGCFTVAALPADTESAEALRGALPAARMVTLGTFEALPESDRKLFVFHLLAVPA